MLRRIINLLRGSVRLEAEGPFPERFLNLCAQRGILFWNVEWLEPTRLRLTVTRSGCRRAVALGDTALCTVTEAGRRGIPSFLGRFRRRYALLTGLALSLAAVGVLSQFVLTIDVQGNTQVPTAVILTALRQQGLRPGVFGPGLDATELGNRALLQLPQLSWLSVNLYGTRAEVLVREATAPPETVDSSQLGDVVAGASGIITRMEVLSGQAEVQAGDTVLEGELLISGTVVLEAPQYSEVPYLGQMEVRAAGRIYARTWRTLTAVIPLEAAVKSYTGQESSRWSLTVLGQRLVFSQGGGISTGEYDTISRTWTLKLPGGREMPLALNRETRRAYTLSAAPLDAGAAEELLEDRLLEALQAVLGQEDAILQTQFESVRSDDKLQVTLRAECSEEIGRFQPRTNTEEIEADQ